MTIPRILGVDFIVSTSEEDHKFSNRYAEVLATLYPMMVI